METLKGPSEEAHSKHQTLLDEDPTSDKEFSQDLDAMQHESSHSLHNIRDPDIERDSSDYHGHDSPAVNGDEEAEMEDEEAEMEGEENRSLQKSDNNEPEEVKVYSDEEHKGQEEEELEEGKNSIDNGEQDLTSTRLDRGHHEDEDITFLTRPIIEEPINIQRFKIKFDTSKITVRKPLSEIAEKFLESFNSAHNQLKESFSAMKTKLISAVNHYKETAENVLVEQQKISLDKQDQEEANIEKNPVGVQENAEEIQENSEEKQEKAKEFPSQMEEIQEKNEIIQDKTEEMLGLEQFSDDANVPERESEIEKIVHNNEEKNIHSVEKLNILDKQDISGTDLDFERDKSLEKMHNQEDGNDIITNHQPLNESYHPTQAEHEDEHAEQSLSLERKDHEFSQKPESQNQISFQTNPLSAKKTSPRDQENRHETDAREIIRRQILEARKEKEVLEEKLKGVEMKIYELKHQRAGSNRTSPRGDRKSPSKDEERILKQKAENLVRRMKWERKQKEMREDQKRRKIELRLEQELEILQSRRIYIEEREMRLAAERRQRIQDRKQEKSREELDDTRLHQSSEERGPPLYQQMEKRYEQEIMLPEIEKRKQILSVRKETFKPLYLQMFHKFEEKYKEEKIKSEFRRKKFLEELRMNVPPTKKYHSNIFKQLMESDNQQKLEEVHKQQEKKARYDTRIQYSKAVRDMFLPKVTPDKEIALKQNAKEILEKAGNLKNYDDYWKDKERQTTIKYLVSSDVSKLPLYSSNKFRSKSPDLVDLKSKITVIKNPSEVSQSQESHRDHWTKKYLKQHQQPSQATISSSKKIQIAKSSINAEMHNHLNNGKDQIYANDTFRKRTHSSVTQERNRQNGSQIEASAVRAKRFQPWDRYIKDENLTVAEKVTFVLNDTKIIEDKAKKRHERLIRRSADVSFDRANEVENDIDELYIQTIKAKLAALEKINEENKNSKNKQTL